MMKKTGIFKKIAIVFTIVIMAILFAPAKGLNSFSIMASAETFGNYTYTVTDNEATITHFDSSVGGNITIPETLGGYMVTKIGANAFLSCAGLQEVNITSNIVSIGVGAFDQCTGLTSINVSADNEYYCNDESGVLYSKDKTELIKYPVGNERTSYEIYDGTVSLSKRAFEECDSITSVKIPNSVTSIGEEAFIRCSSLSDAAIPESVTSIGDLAFYITALKDVVISENVTSIGVKAFSYISALKAISVSAENSNYSGDSNGVLYNKDKTELIRYPAGKENVSFTVPDSVTTIKISSFNGNDFLEKLIIPNNVSDIEEASFNNCSSLQKLIILNPECQIFFKYFGLFPTLPNTTVIYGFDGSTAQSFASKNKNTFVPFEDCTHEDTTTYSKQSATCTVDGYTEGVFCNDCQIWISGHETILATGHTDENNDGLCDVCGAKYIDFSKYTYTYSDNILSVYGNYPIPSADSPEDYPWHQYANSAKSIFIDDGITSIGENAFTDFSNAGIVVLKDSVAFVANNAFSNCKAIKYIVSFGNSVNIESGAFSGCQQNITLYEKSGFEHTGILPENIATISFDFDASTLTVYGDMTANAYDLFDFIAVMCDRYDNVMFFKFNHFTSLQFTFMYYGEDKIRKPVPDNTIENVQFSVEADYRGSHSQISFNTLCEGVATGEIQKFYLITENQWEEDIDDTRVDIQDEESFLQKALRFLVTLFNKIFLIFTKWK